MQRPAFDLHSHLYPEWYLDELRERPAPPLVSRSPEGERLVVIPDTEGVPLSPAFWSVDEKIRFMDEWGIEMSLLSPGNPWLTFLAGDERSSRWADRINEDMASLAERSGGRLLTLGVLPASTIGDCVAAVERARERAHVRGFITGSEICGMDLDDDGLDPLWEALEASACILMIHPGMASLSSRRHLFGLTIGVSFPLETTVAASRLLLAGVPSGWPRVKFFLAHGGGALPICLGGWTTFGGRRDAADLARARSRAVSMPTPSFIPPGRRGSRRKHSAMGACCGGRTIPSRFRAATMTYRGRTSRMRLDPSSVLRQPLA